MGGGVSAKLNDAKTGQDRMIDDLLHNKAKLKEMWKRLDFNGNGMASLAEVDKFIVSIPGFQRFNNKPALMRAFKKTTKGGNGDSYVQMREFPKLLQSIYYFDKLWKVFANIDTGNDRRVDLGEFKKGLSKLGIKLSDNQAANAFRQMDKNGGGQVLFDEFCRYAARMASGEPIALDGPPPQPQAKQQQQQRRKGGPPRAKQVKQLSPLERLVKEFDAVSGSKPYVESEELGLVLQRSSMNCTRAEFLQLSDKLGLNDDGRVSRKEFVAFFTNKLAPRNNAKFNRMLIKPTIGKAKSSSYNLPPEYHTYGNKLPRDSEGAKDVIFSWDQFQPTTVHDQKLNIVKMNKNAMKHGATSPKAISRFNKTHKIYDEKTLSGSKSREQMLADNRKITDPRIRNATFGITARAGTPIGNLITGSYGAVDDEADYPRSTAADNRRKKKQNAKRFDSSRPTKASLGHAQARQRLADAQNQPAAYKMKRFSNVKSRLGGGGGLSVTGQDIVRSR